MKYLEDNMAEEKSLTREFNIENLMGNVQSVQVGSDIYSNFAQVTMTNNELIMDLFVTGPLPGNREVVRLTHLQRVVFPIPVAEGLVRALKQTIESFKANHIGDIK